MSLTELGDELIAYKPKQASHLDPPRSGMRGLHTTVPDFWLLGLRLRLSRLSSRRSHWLTHTLTPGSHLQLLRPCPYSLFVFILTYLFLFSHSGVCVCVKIRWLVYSTNCHIWPCQILLGMPTQRQSLLPGKPGTPRSSSHSL